ncbi:hypothetical protein [Micromonospora globispora]|uniref:hypothetical protein n=1 Tax=Micromonospora globispora TaxID=1450148 RepID=UPI001FAF9A2C|nr:hypothetical protein [Micromonospora globispora]
MAHPLTRRRLLLAGSGAAAVAVVGGLTAQELSRPRLGPAPTQPDAPVGDERLIRIRSGARGREVGFWTAVPEGHGDGRGLPVCLVLHGASATAEDFPGFGFARFLTDAVRRARPGSGAARAAGPRRAGRRPAQLRLLEHRHPGRVRPPGCRPHAAPRSMTPPAHDRGCRAAAQYV